MSLEKYTDAAGPFCSATTSYRTHPVSTTEFCAGVGATLHPGPDMSKKVLQAVTFTHA